MFYKCKQRDIDSDFRKIKAKFDARKICLLIIVLMCTIFCYGQYHVPNYLSANNFSTIEKYLKENIDRLDPIEGIYNAQMTRDFQYISRNGFGQKFYHDGGSGSFSFRCAIYRYTDNSFHMALESFNSDLKIVNSKITHIGETGIYNFNIEYPPKFIKERWYLGDSYFYCNTFLSCSTRAALEAQVAINFEVNIKNKCHVQRDNSKTEGYDVDIILQDNYSLIKEYPTSSMYNTKPSKQEKRLWTGTGFALGNSYIVTNQHVIDEANTISIKGIKGDLNNGYSAAVVTVDKANDIAVLKINDTRFNGFGAIPYSVSTRMADVGEDVFVLGFPLTQALGNEIKLTNGIISSRTGYQGDIATYQISAPVQPGNSGGPMFDKKGNVIGIVVAGVPGAENVGYAIKTSYLSILNESAGLNIKFPSNNTISSFPLAEKVKKVKDFVFYIECSN